MTNYRIENNSAFNSLEIYFDGKPSEEVRSALKALKFRWHSIKKCWYGYAEQSAVIAAITNNETENGGIVSEGYMGATRWDGNKSGKFLYGSELSAAIRAEFKAAGLKGVTISSKTYSGGQSILVKCKFTPEDMVDFEEFYDSFSYSDLPFWVNFNGSSYPKEAFIAMCDGHYDEYMRVIAAEQYNHYAARGFEVNGPGAYLKTYAAFTEAFKAKLQKICAIVNSYNYNDSNGMVDYFDTNFYATIKAEAA